jgi:hypothetical protein
MSVSISAPYPKQKVTTILPDPLNNNTRASESDIQLKRGMTGKVWSYIQTSSKSRLSLTFILSRQKDLELQEFVRVYHAAKFWKLTDHDGNEWKVKLIGEPIRREAIGRINSNTSSTGGESRKVTLNFSAEAL